MAKSIENRGENMATARDEWTMLVNGKTEKWFGDIFEKAS